MSSADLMIRFGQMTLGEIQRRAAHRRRFAMAKATAPVLENLENRQLLSVGGGFTDAGLRGDYYSTPDWNAANLQFTRRDVRVDFDWANLLKPGGSQSTDFQAVGNDNYSVRWTGQIIARFSESYTFKGEADDYFVLKIKPAGGPTWTTVVNQTTTGIGVGVYAMTAGSKYDVQIDYKELTGNAKAKLRWSSPSTPEEVIEPETVLSYHPQSGAVDLTANLIRGSGSAMEGTLDANGWPTTATSKVYVAYISAALPYTAGTYEVSFKGQAKVGASRFGTMWVGATSYTSLPKGVGYDPLTQMTTFKVVVGSGGASSNPELSFQLAERPDGTPGLTDLRVMKPIAQGSTTSYDRNRVVSDGMRDVLSYFTSFRWNNLNGGAPDTTWSTRLSPDAHKLLNSTQQNLESLIQISNETGKDLWLCLPHKADADYITKTAQAIRYGTDAAGNPYATFQADPVHPGLNPNLKVYVEYSNEVWNAAGGYPQTNNVYDMGRDEITAGTAVGLKLNYDGALNSVIGTTGTNRPMYFDVIRRYYANKTVEISDAFRAVFEPTNNTTQMTRVRPVLSSWYINTWDATRKSLAFLEDSGQYPMPINYYIYGGGGVSYWSSLDSNGRNSGVTVSDPSFESGGSGWTITGPAAIVANADPIGNPAAPNGTNAIAITGTGSIRQDLYIPANGTYALVFNSAALKDATTGADKGNHVDFYINGVKVTPQNEVQGNLNVSSTPWHPKKFGHNAGNYYIDQHLGGALNWDTTIPITLTAGQTVSIEIVGRDTVDKTTFFDQVYLASAEAIIAQMPAVGQAAGQPQGGQFSQDARQQKVWSGAYGLKMLSYESGISLGGDFSQTTLQYYVKHILASTADDHVEADDVLVQAGADAYSLYYPQFRTFQVSSGNYASHPLYVGLDQIVNRQRLEVDNGLAVPATLTSSAADLKLTSSGAAITNTTLPTKGYFAWNIIAPTSGNYRIGVATEAGGNFQLFVDGNLVMEGASGTTFQTTSATRFLTKGYHNIRLRSNSGSFSVNGIGVTQPGVPFVPALTAVTAAGPNTIQLTWLDGSDDETGFQLQRATDAAFTAGLVTQSMAVNQTSFSDTGLTSGTRYYYRIRATGTSGNSSWSTISSNATYRAYTGETTLFDDQVFVVSPLSATYTSGSSALNAWFTSGTNPSTISATGGNPDEYLKYGNSGSDSLFAVAAPTVADTWTVRFDHLAPASNSGMNLRVYGLTAGQSSTRFTRGGTQLASFALTPPASGWASVTQSFNVPAGYQTIALIWDNVQSGGGIDNVTLTRPTLTAASGVFSTATSSSQTTLNWTDNTAGETGYKVERKTGTDGTWAQVGTAAANATSFADSGLSPSTLYFYRVRATNADGDSAYSNETSANTLVHSIRYGEDFSNLDADWTTTTQNGGTATFSGGKLTVGPLTANGEAAFIRRSQVNAGASSYRTQFDVNLSGLSFNPTASTVDTADTIRLYTLFNSGNNPVTALSLRTNTYSNKYDLMLNTGIQYSGGTQTGANLVSLPIATVQGASAGFRVVIDTSFANPSGLNWTITNTATVTDIATGTVVATLTRDTSGAAVNSSFNPLAGTLVYSLGNGGWTGSVTAYSRHALMTPAEFSGTMSFDNVSVSPTSGTNYVEDFSSALTSPWTTTTQTGGTATVTGGQLQVGPLTTNGEAAYIQRSFTNNGSSSYRTEFDLNLSGLDFNPTGSSVNTTDNIRIYTLFNNGNTPVTALNVRPNTYVDKYELSLNTGIQYAGGTQTGAYLVQLPISTIEGAASGFHVVIDTTFTNTGGLNWTITNTATFTNIASGVVVATLIRNTSGAAVNSSFNPLTGTLVASFGNGGWTGSVTSYSRNASLTTAEFSGVMLFDNINVIPS